MSNSTIYVRNLIYMFIYLFIFFYRYRFSRCVCVQWNCARIRTHIFSELVNEL